MGGKPPCLKEGVEASEWGGEQWEIGSERCAEKVSGVGGRTFTKPFAPKNFCG